MKASGRLLSDEDRILWANVVRSTRPLKGKAAIAQPLSEPTDTKAEKPTGPAPIPSIAPAVRPRPTTPRTIDAPVRDRIAKGKVALDGRIDLHGLTQAHAHSLLLAFLRRGHDEGRRHVLVITGKGASFGSDGVLRRAVPDWFATPPFRALVSGYSDASRAHGGAGALYVRLARNRAAQT